MPRGLPRGVSLKSNIDTLKKRQIVAIVQLIYLHQDYQVVVIHMNGMALQDLGDVLKKQCSGMKVKVDLITQEKD